MSTVPSPLRAAGRVVGRAALLGRLDEVLGPGRPRGGVLLVGGEAGQGKTRVVLEATRRAKAAGSSVIQGRAGPSESALPFSVFQDALRAERRDQRAAPALGDPLAARFPLLLLPELGGTSGSAEDRGVLFEAASSYVRCRGGDSGVLLALEDLHWADPTSLDLVHYLARTATDAGVVIIVTYRPDLSRPGLSGLRQRIIRERMGEEHILVGLVPDEVADLVDAVAGVACEKGFTELVARLSQGNPFMVEELVRHAVLGGHVDPQTGRWRGDVPASMPWTVREMLLERAQGLTTEDRDVLDWAAVAGTEVELPLLAEAAGIREDSLLGAVGRLVQTGFLTQEPDDPGVTRFAFRHELTRQAVLDEIQLAGRRMRHARIVVAAEDLFGDSVDAHLELLSTHALGAADRPRAFGYLARAARRSAELCGYAEADAQFTKALQLWDPACGAEARAAALLDHGRLLSRLRRDARSPSLLGEARSEYLALGRRVPAAQALAAAAAARWNLGVRDGVVEELSQALGELRRGDPLDARLEVMTYLARSWFMAGQLQRAEGITQDGIQRARAATGAAARHGIHLRTTLGSSQWLSGDTDAGDATLLGALHLAESSGDDLGAVRVRSDLAYWHLNRSHASAAAHAEAGLALAERLSADLPIAWLCNAHALINAKSGDLGTAAAFLGRAEAAAARVGPDPELRLAIAWARTEWLLVNGSIEAASETIEPLVAEGDAMGDLQLVTRLRRSSARVCLEAGTLDAAADALAPVLARWENLATDGVRTPVRLAVTAAEVASLGRDRQLGALTHALFAQRDAAPRVSYGRALALAAQGVRPRLGALGTSASAIEADGWRFEAGRMLLVGARALVDAPGARDEVIGLAEAARVAFDDLGLAWWRQRALETLRHAGSRAPGAAGTGAGGLSAREIEVLRLVAHGESNRGIADRLVISEKTAARHVANIFIKLGAKRRAEAVRVAVERGLLPDLT